MNALERSLNRIRTEYQGGTNTANYICHKCKDTGYIMSKDENGYQMAEKCECFAMKQARELLERSGISEEFSRKTFANFDTRGIPQLANARNKAVQYVKGFREFERERYNSIIFAGQVGSGKTHLGTAICGMLMNTGIPVVYMAYRNAVTKIKQNITDEQAYSSALNKYTFARVLYIDDFLKGRLTEADVNIMYEIVNYRYMNNLPIILSTEKRPDELLAFDEAIGSRLMEMCKGNIVQLQGKELNYRLS